MPETTPDESPQAKFPVLWDAFIAGFAASGEGFNGEHPPTLNPQENGYLRDAFVEWLEPCAHSFEIGRKNRRTASSSQSVGSITIPRALPTASRTGSGRAPATPPTTSGTPPQSKRSTQPASTTGGTDEPDEDAAKR